MAGLRSSRGTRSESLAIVKQASQLMDATERIAGLDDLRDLESLRRYVTGDQAVRFDDESGEFNEVEVDHAAARWPGEKRMGQRAGLLP